MPPLQTQFPAIFLSRNSSQVAPDGFFDFAADDLTYFSAPTWQILSARAANTPTVGSSLFDAGADTFESGTYGWAAQGTNVMSNDAGELKLVYGNNSQGAILNLSQASDLSANLTASRKYLYRANCRVNSGGNAQIFISSGRNYFLTVTEAVKTQKELVVTYLSGTPQVWAPFGLSTGETFWLDDQLLGVFDLTSMMALCTAEAAQVSGDVVVRAQVRTAVDGHEVGIVACCDSAANPQNYVIATLDRACNTVVRLHKVVGGTITELIAATPTSVWYDDAYLEIRRSGNNFSLWYDDAQVGTTQAISDAGIVNNVLHGMYASGGANTITSIAIVPNDLDALDVGYIGGSITWTPEGYARKTYQQIQNANIEYDVVRHMIAYNGQLAWEEMAWLSNNGFTVTPSSILIDLAANHLSNNDFENETIEALVRRLRTLYPQARLIMPIFGVWANINSTATSGSSTTRRAQLVSLCQHYDIDYVDVGATMEATIAGGATLADWYLSADTTHPSNAGHIYIASLLEDDLTLANIQSGASQWTGDLADYARLYAGSDAYDDAYTVINGVDHDGETGTGWSTVSTTYRQSSTANDTISFTFTGTSFGLQTSAAGTIQWSIDGGAYSSNFALGTRPTRLLVSGLSNAEHTITFKVISGTVQVQAFVAI